MKKAQIYVGTPDSHDIFRVLMAAGHKELHVNSNTLANIMHFNWAYLEPQTTQDELNLYQSIFVQSPNTCMKSSSSGERSLVMSDSFDCSSTISYSQPKKG